MAAPDPAGLSGPAPLAPTLAELAERFGLETAGDAATRVTGVCALAPGQTGGLAFLGAAKHRPELAGTAAAAVVVGPADTDALAGPGLVARRPAETWARIAALFDPDRAVTPGVHPTAVIDPTATLGAGCEIGPHAVVGAGARLGAGCRLGPGVVVEPGVVVGNDARLGARTFLGRGTVAGDRLVTEAGAVIGARGFGNTPRADGSWLAVPQLGGVRLGHDVEIGANTCVDRGALDDTVLEDGVRLDNQVMIAHNCRIGAHTAIAACTGIAGSTRVGRHCLIGGAVGIAGHLEIADKMFILAGGMITKSIAEPGAYGSVLPAAPAPEWRRMIARLRRLGRLESRVRSLERGVGLPAAPGPDDGSD